MERRITEIALHWLGEVSSFDFVGVYGVEEVKRWHLDMGYIDVGYHWFVDRRGMMYAGRSESIQGAHVYGHNRNTLGVCVMYGTQDKEVTQETLNALIDLLASICMKYKLDPQKAIKGHSDYLPTMCPGILYRHLGFIRDRVALKILGEPPRANIRTSEGIIDGLIINNRVYAPIGDLPKVLPVKVSWENHTKTAFLDWKRS